MCLIFQRRNNIVEKFRKKLKNRIIFIILYLVAVIAFIIISKIFNLNPDGLSIAYVIGFSCGILGVMLFQLFIFCNALKDDDKLEELYINENDERVLQIEGRAGRIVARYTLLSLIAAVLIAVFINKTVAITLIAVMLAMAIFTIIVKLICSKKY